jgi:dihydroflavonol-4-reductase
LRQRGDSVVGIVRDRRRAAHLEELGINLVEDDLADVARLVDVLAGADAVVHAAGMYRIGIPRRERGAMWDANVGTTTRVLDAAERAGTQRIVDLSSVNVFGNTRGRVVDESFRRDLADGFVSWYDETKYGAHEVAEQRIAGGAPIVLTRPGQVIGPGDHSEIGTQLLAARDGRLRYVASGDLGITLVHVADVAAGIVAALDRGAVGRSYVLAGEAIRFVDALAIAAAVGGRRLPRIRIPNGVLRAMVPSAGCWAGGTSARPWPHPRASPTGRARRGRATSWAGRRGIPRRRSARR